MGAPCGRMTKLKLAKNFKKHSKGAFLFSPKKSKQDKSEMHKERSAAHMPCDDIVHHIFHLLYVYLCSFWIGNCCWEVWQHLWKKLFGKKMPPLAFHKRKENRRKKKKKNQLNHGKKKEKKIPQQNLKETAFNVKVNWNNNNNKKISCQHMNDI